ncbi:MAG: ribokinase [Alphaproteobacteria bacterium]|nr:ribokinase [Alphaproteobacteria bacterium]
MIVVFGSIGLDIVQSVERLPRPGETVLTADYVMLPGGKGANQALAAARAGGSVQFVASVGDDDFGRLALANLDQAGVALSQVARRQRPTACATISVDRDGENQIVVSSGANLATKAEQLQAGSRQLAPGDLVLQQMEIPLPEICAGVELAHRRGARNILNAAPFQPIPPATLAKLDSLIVNEVEAEMLADNLGLDSGDLKAACDEVRRRFDVTVVLTLGADGAITFAPDQTLRANALPIQALDTVGAGDAFVGAFVAAMGAEMALSDCLRWGSVAGGLACLKPGAQDGVPDRVEIQARQDEIAVSAL